MDREKLHVLLQEDLLSLIRVLDFCMTEIDLLYCKVVKERMLSSSNNN